MKTDLKYVRTDGQTEWYECQQCHRLQHKIEFYNYKCGYCSDQEVK